MWLVSRCRCTGPSIHQHSYPGPVPPKAQRAGISSGASPSLSRTTVSFLFLSPKLKTQTFHFYQNVRRHQQEAFLKKDGSAGQGPELVRLLICIKRVLNLAAFPVKARMKSCCCVCVSQALFADCQAHIWAVEGRKWWRVIDFRSLGTAVHCLTHTCPLLPSVALANFVKVCVDERRDNVARGSFHHIFCCMIDLKEVPYSFIYTWICLQQLLKWTEWQWISVHQSDRNDFF